jgi:hypothetical protein
VGKSEAERLFVKCIVMWGDNIMDIGNACRKFLTCLDVAQYRKSLGAVLNAVINFRVPKIC